MNKMEAGTLQLVEEYFYLVVLAMLPCARLVKEAMGLLQVGIPPFNPRSRVVRDDVRHHTFAGQPAPDLHGSLPQPCPLDGADPWTLEDAAMSDCNPNLNMMTPH